MNSKKKLAGLAAVAALLGGLCALLAWWGGPRALAVEPETAGGQGSGPAAPASDVVTATLVFLPAVDKDYAPVVLPPPPAPQPYVLATISLPPGSHPHGIALDIAGQRAFVGNHGAGTLSVIDTAGMALATTIPLPGGLAPNGVAYHAGRDRVYVAHRNSGNVSIVDPAAGTVVAQPAVGAAPDGVAVQGELVYVANFDSGDVSVIDARTGAVTGTIGLPAGSQPSMLAAGDDGMVYLTLHGSGEVYTLFNGQIWNARSDVPAPYGLGIDAVYRRLYVANRGAAQSVTMVDLDYNTLLGAIPVGQEPYVVGANPRTGHVFVVCGDRVKVYDRRDEALLATIPVGPGTEEGVAVDPGRNLVYVTSGDADQVTVIQDIPTLDLAYVSYEDGRQRLVVSDQTGYHTDVITSCSACALGTPAWQPGGRRLAFSSALDGDPDIWSIGAGGQSPVNLTAELGDLDQEPTWSPDGRRIAWRHGMSVWLMDADGGHKRSVSIGYSARTPRWSPDGNWIAFVAYVGDHEDVLIAPVEGDDATNLTQNPAVDLGPSWSPDGQSIAFETNRSGNYDIYRVDLATYPAVLPIANGPGPEHAAAWSPDGAGIAYLSDLGQAQYDYAVWLAAPDGSSHRRLSRGLHLVGQMSWSDDARWLAVQGGLFEQAEIYVVDAPAGDVFRLTTDGVQQEAPAWRPDAW